MGYPEAFKKQLNLQNSLIETTPLVPESYFNVMPMGRTLDDDELDEFICQEIFGEEFRQSIVEVGSMPYLEPLSQSKAELDEIILPMAQTKGQLKALPKRSLKSVETGNQAGARSAKLIATELVETIEVSQSNKKFISDEKKNEAPMSLVSTATISPLTLEMTSLVADDVGKSLRESFQKTSAAASPLLNKKAPEMSPVQVSDSQGASFVKKILYTEPDSLQLSSPRKSQGKMAVLPSTLRTQLNVLASKLMPNKAACPIVVSVYQPPVMDDEVILEGYKQSQTEGCRTGSDAQASINGYQFGKKLSKATLEERIACKQSLSKSINGYKDHLAFESPRTQTDHNQSRWSEREPHSTRPALSDEGKISISSKQPVQAKVQLNSKNSKLDNIIEPEIKPSINKKPKKRTDSRNLSQKQKKVTESDMKCVELNGANWIASGYKFQGSGKQKKKNCKDIEASGSIKTIDLASTRKARFSIKNSQKSERYIDSPNAFTSGLRKMNHLEYVRLNPLGFGSNSDITNKNGQSGLAPAKKSTSIARNYESKSQQNAKLSFNHDALSNCLKIAQSSMVLSKKKSPDHSDKLGYLATALNKTQSNRSRNQATELTSPRRKSLKKTLRHDKRQFF